MHGNPGKTALFILVFLIASGKIYSQQYWIAQPSPTTKWLYDMTFVDSLYGWAAGDSGIIIHTSNSGQNWAVQQSGITDYLVEDIFFINRLKGWAVVNDFQLTGTKILITSDGGERWESTQFQDTTVIINTIFFREELTGFATGFTGEIFKSTNGGNSWSKTQIDTTPCYLSLFPKYDINFLNANTGFVCGGHIDIQGIIWRTTDGGLNWLTYCVTPEPLYKVKALNSNRIISCGGDFEYGAMTSQSYNGGSQWLYDTTGFLGIARSLAFRTPSELWMPLTYSLLWAVNTDSGSINSPWIAVPVSDTSAVYSAVFMSPTFGWACGTNGSLYKYNSSIIGISQNSGIIPGRFTLIQNYPNPFNSTSKIIYKIKKTSDVVLRIFDAGGRHVRTLVNRELQPGTYVADFDGTGLASGIYFCVLKSGQLTETKKMVLLK